MPLTATEKTETLSVPALLCRLSACGEAREWAREMSAARAWETCPRGDWMLWLAARVGVDRKLVVRAACDCARLALPHVRAGEERPLRAIETAEAWCDGRATLQEVRAAADASHAAAAAAYASYAAAYASAAAAADAAADASYAAAYASYAAAYASYAAAAYAAAARSKIQQQCADIVRRRIPLAVVLAADLVTRMCAMSVA